MKLSNIILNEQNEFKSQIEALERELNQEYRPYVSMGAYHQPRPDSDPLKNKGFGSVTFLHKDELPENEFNYSTNPTIVSGSTVHQNIISGSNIGQAPVGKL